MLHGASGSDCFGSSTRAHSEPHLIDSAILSSSSHSMDTQHSCVQPSSAIAIRDSMSIDRDFCRSSQYRRSVHPFNGNDWKVAFCLFRCIPYPLCAPFRFAFVSSECFILIWWRDAKLAALADKLHLQKYSKHMGSHTINKRFHELPSKTLSFRPSFAFFKQKNATIV